MSGGLGQRMDGYCGLVLRGEVNWGWKGMRFEGTWIIVWRVGVVQGLAGSRVRGEAWVGFGRVWMSRGRGEAGPRIVYNRGSIILEGTKRR